MKYLIYFLTSGFVGYIFAEWNLLIGKTYLKMIDDQEINKEDFKFLFVHFCYFCLWPVRTTCSEPQKYYLWQLEERTYKVLMTLGGSAFKIIANPFLIFAILIIYWISLLASSYIIPETTGEKS